MITVFVLLLDTVIVQTMLAYIVDLGYVGLVIAGMMFVSFFTAAPGIALLLAFTEVYNPIIVSVVAGCGAAAGDFIILRYVEDRVGRELKPIAQRLQLMAFVDQLHKKAFKPITVTIGAIIIASPFPDEAGLALLGLSKIRTVSLLFLTFVLNSAGILVILLAFG